MISYRDLCKALRDAGAEEADFEAALLAERFCGLSRAALLADPARMLDHAALADAIERRRQGEPIQYILGEWDFFRERYFVSPHCLIPRPETELLVERAIGLLPKGARFADLCTGSGCIAVSTLANRPDCTGVAVDLFPETLALAQKNATRNGVDTRLSFVRADVLSPTCLAEYPSFDAILSNPPYINSDVVPTLERELFFEPAAALDGGRDGLDFYRAIVKNFASRLTEGGFMLFEIGYDQEDAIKGIAAAHGFACAVEKDLAGQPRMALLTR